MSKAGGASAASPARLVALEATKRIREQEAYAKQVAEPMIAKSDLSPADADFALRLILGVAATASVLDYCIDRNLKSPADIKANVRDALRISTYELIYLGKEPYAVVDQGVELTRAVTPRAAGLANAVLRKIANDAQEFPWGDPSCDLDAATRACGYPSSLAHLIEADRGFDETCALMRSSVKPAPLFLATNPFRSSDEELLARVKEADLDAHPFGVPGCIIATQAAPVIDSGIIDEGFAVVADAAAQIVCTLAAPDLEGAYLEVGSGRGTKSALLQAASFRERHATGPLYALDLHEFKCEILSKRMETLSVPNVTPVCGDATALQDIEGLPDLFSGILIDAPCSGLGTLRRHPEQRCRVSEAACDDLATLGASLLASAAQRVAPRGHLTYATCTVLKREDEQVIEAFLASEEGSAFLLVNAGEILAEKQALTSEIEPFITPEGYFRSVPTEGGMDGHFCAVLERRA